MTLSEVSKLRKEKPREFDALVAVHVMGITERKVRVKASTETVSVFNDNPAISDGVWTKSDLENYGDPYDYHHNPSRDYAVLRHVREKWDESQKEEFIDALRELLRVRDTDYSTRGTLYLVLFGNGDAPGLSVGDYAAAALAAAMGREKN